jgi:4-oxalocrotonate tautomerase
MPIIIINGPPIYEIEKKRILVRDLTQAAVQTYELPKEKIQILIKENQPENVGTGGELLSDRKNKTTQN